ncbi:general transcription factor 3C polypeptide 5 [Pseudophryne corroboree]|uniref:general transcription factor 3C polypeptide 5 n=1 Tax=Pseudophryne corroboree TaxID=495146 RepID=UPI0030820795
MEGSGTVTLPRSQKLMVCVEYPGLVQNVDKMLLTLGGEEAVSRVYADPSKRLELYFRPKDPYCHPLCANRFPTTTMILRVKKKTRKKSPIEAEMGNQDPEGTVSMEIIGVVGTVYKFQGMADFQYLAFTCGTDGSRTSLYDKILLKKPEKEDFFHQDITLHIPPPIFSRLDTQVDYYYRPNINHRDGYQPPHLSSDNLIGLSRARRPHNAIFVVFEDEVVPTEPHPAAAKNWRKICTNTLDKKIEQEMRRLFNIRPIWSRSAIKANVSLHPDKLKLLLPYVAYYMLTGPWRSLWVRFGYDPRKNPEAKIYQLLDFRIRCGMKYGYTPNEMPVKAKRSTYNYSLPITLQKPTPQAVSMQDLTHGLGASSSKESKKPPSNKYKLKDSVYIFREGNLPPYRQMFYQLCDLNVDSLQEVIKRNDGAETECTERDGWCLPKTSDQLRDSMSLMIKQIIRSKRPALFSGPSTSADSKEQLTYESGDEEEDEEEEEEFHPSEGSENEMETELLDYV